MGWDAPWHWVILALLVIALFGYKKMPEAARALGRSMRIFKSEIKGMSEDDAARATRAEIVPPAGQPAAAPPAGSVPVAAPTAPTAAPVAPTAAPVAPPVPTPVQPAPVAEAPADRPASS